MINLASFKVRRTELLSVLKRFKALEKSGLKKQSTLEVTIIDNFLKLIIPGVELPIAATTKGTAKFTMKLAYFNAIASTEKDEVFEFTLKDNLLTLKSFSWNVPTTFFENDRILRSINLPVNYSWLEVARLYLSEKYTTEEIEFNNLGKDVMAAIHKLNGDIDKIASVTKKYGFTREEIKMIIASKLT